jgi:adenine phosphoribosyltransferase
VQADLDYRGRSNTLRIQRAAISSGDRILLVDDWIETGNQALAAKRLIECCGAEMVGIATVVTQAPAEVLDRLGQAHALIRADQLAGHQPPQQNV